MGLWRAGLFAITAGLLFAGEIQLTAVERSVIGERFSRLRSDNEGRMEVLREILQEAGCGGEHYAEQPVKGARLPNLVCTLRGMSEKTIVVSAHFDKVSAGEGAIDNWSGAALLPSLYQTLGGFPRQLTFVFILFTEEEKGLVGSRAFVHGLTAAQRRNIYADINVDSVGLPGSINIWVSRADKTLVKAASAVASALQIKLQGVSIDNVGDSDSAPFHNAHIPVIDFHSITQATLPLLHTSRDVQTAIDPSTYYDTYRLLASLLGYLDAQGSHTD